MAYILPPDVKLCAANQTCVNTKGNWLTILRILGVLIFVLSLIAAIVLTLPIFPHDFVVGCVSFCLLFLFVVGMLVALGVVP